MKKLFFYYFDGTIYEGEYKDGQPNGLFTLPDGSKYKGVMLNGETHGHGLLELADGEKYIGEF